MKYAHFEMERRFLSSSLPEGIGSVSDITDFYLIGTRLRLRRVVTDGRIVLKLGQKVRFEGGPRRIAHTTIYLDEGEWEALSSLSAKRLHKLRYQVEREGDSFAIDEHDDGTLIAEFDGGDQPPGDPPSWLAVTREITDDERSTGGELAAN